MRGTLRPFTVFLTGLSLLLQGGSCLAADPLLWTGDRTEPRALRELFTDLAMVAPTDKLATATEVAFALHDRWLKRTNDPPAAEAVALLSRARGVARELQAALPGLTVYWQNDRVAVAPKSKPLRLARGLEHTLLVEVVNLARAPVELRVAAGGAPRPPMAPQWIPASGARLFRVSVRVDTAGARDITVLIGPAAGAETRKVMIPIEVVEPARVRGLALEGETGKPTPGRIHVRCSDGVLRHGREFAGNQTLSSKPLLAFTFAGLNQSYTLPFFYTSGTFDLLVPPGETSVTLERGFEHPLVTTNLSLKAGEMRDVALSSKRFYNMKSEGWISGDTHIHWAKNWWSQDEDIALLGLVQRAEDLRVANNLTLKHHVGHTNFIAPTQFPMGPIPGLCDGEYHAQMAEEWRNEEFYGHLVLLNLQRLVEPISTGFMGGAPHFWDWPHNLQAIRETRAQGGIVIEAHGLGRNANVPVDVAHHFADALDQIDPEDYYRFLDCGFQVPLSNGSDHPARVAGCARVYVKTSQPFTYRNWIEGIRSNRTFTTSGPLLFLDVNGHDIGDVLAVQAGTRLKIRARAVSRHPLGVLQIISNGRMLGEKPTREREAELEIEIPAGEPRWIVARVSQTDNFNALAGPHIAHTSATYVQVDGRPRFLAAAAREWATRMKRHAEDIRRDGRFPKAQQREEAVNYVLDGVKRFEELIRQNTAP